MTTIFYRNGIWKPYPMKVKVCFQYKQFFDQVNRDWNVAWEKSLTPWDLKGIVSPPLIEAVESNDLILSSNSKVLVPGCGSGYDCLYFYRNGVSKTVGIDLSSKAIEISNKNLLNYQKLETHNHKNNIEFSKYDFFNFFSIRNEKYDIIYDYLFFSALEPELRLQWAKSMKLLLIPNSGVFVTILFPLYNGSHNKNIGPPYHIDIDDYKILLEPLGFVLHKYREDIKSVKQRQGREAIAYWKLVNQE